MPDLHNPVKAIRAKCMRCTCDQPGEIDKCPIVDCPLYPFRYGKNPYRAKRVITPEQNARNLETLAMARAALKRNGTA